MRRLLGYVVALLGLSFLAILFLRLWDIAPIHWDVIIKVFLTLVLLLAAATLVIIVRYAFFKELPNWRRWPARRPAPAPDDTYRG